MRSIKNEVVESSVEGVYVEEEEVGGELKENRDRIRFLFNLMPGPVIIIDNKGRFLAINDRVEEKTGFKREELLGKNSLKTKIVTAKSKLVLIKNLTKRMAGMHPAPYEVEALTKDGGKIPVEVNAVKIEYEGKTVPAKAYYSQHPQQSRQHYEFYRGDRREILPAFCGSHARSGAGR